MTVNIDSTTLPDSFEQWIEKEGENPCIYNVGYPVYQDEDIEIRLEEETSMWHVVYCYTGQYVSLPFRYLDMVDGDPIFMNEDREFLSAAKLLKNSKGEFEIYMCQRAAQIIMEFEVAYSPDCWVCMDGDGRIHCSPSKDFLPDAAEWLQDEE